MVCNNTAASKLVYDYISGFQQAQTGGGTSLVEGRLPLFRNYDELGRPLGRPKTLLIDSEQLESGEACNGALLATRYPVSPGHTLLIPKRHTGSFFDLSEQERGDLLGQLDRAKLALDQEFQPQGYNIGINDGAAAGQTVPHLHVHLIPRFDGELPDPRGGVRWVIPGKAKYWP